MSWTAITDEQINAQKLGAMVEALRTAALAQGQGDRLDSIQAEVVRTIRRKVAACRTNRVDADTTKIPASLMAIACRMILREGKIALEIALSEDERTQWNKDDRELDKVASCDMPIDESDSAEAAPVQSTQPGPSICARKKRYGRSQQDGV